MSDNYTSFKMHSNYYAGILDVIEDLPEGQKDSILAEYLLAFHKYGVTRELPKFKNKLAQGFFKTQVHSLDKSLADNDNYYAAQAIGSVGGKQKAINAKIAAAEKRLQASTEKLQDLEAKVQQAGQSNAAQKTKQQKKQAVEKLDWHCVAGVELTEEEQEQARRIRKENNTAKKVQLFTQATLKQFLQQIKLSLDAGISISETIEFWECKQWNRYSYKFHADEISSNLNAQSNTRKNLTHHGANNYATKNDSWDVEESDLSSGVIAILEGGELFRQEQASKNKKQV
tara:strand:- start:311 stop:1168 length:858 start_codon:yes stop_codon:yes gene_type:complete